MTFLAVIMVPLGWRRLEYFAILSYTFLREIYSSIRWLINPNYKMGDSWRIFFNALKGYFWTSMASFIVLSLYYVMTGKAILTDILYLTIVLYITAMPVPKQETIANIMRKGALIAIEAPRFFMTEEASEKYERKTRKIRSLLKPKK